VRGDVCTDIGYEPYDLVVNATSASLKGELPPVPATAFAPDGLAYELVYGKGLTPFLRLADGVGMLVEQAARAVIDRMTVPLT